MKKKRTNGECEPRKRKKNRLDEYNDIFSPCQPNAEPRGENETENKTEWDALKVDACKLRLHEIKSIYARYRKVLKVFLGIGFVILGLLLGFNSLFCPCKCKAFPSENAIVAIVELVYTAFWLVFDLILLAQNPEKYFSEKYTALRKVMDAVLSVAEYCARLGQYYCKLIESYQTAIQKLKRQTIIEMFGVILAFLVLLINIVLIFLIH